MSTIALNAASVDTPAPSHPTDTAMTVSVTVNGHGENSVADTGPGVVQVKSCGWSNFVKYATEQHTFPYTSMHQAARMTLKFDWNIPVGGAAADNSGGGSASAEASFIVGLSTDGGSNFSDILTKSVSVSGVDTQSLIESGSVSQDVPVSPLKDLSQIAVRSRIRANASESGGGDADASVTASISNLRLEVVENNDGGGGMM